ncbi:MAG: hypothetical protein AAFU64_21005, partial [Bacteroidota bacterium]
KAPAIQAGQHMVFKYQYDSRGRMIVKKVPGAGEVRMVYDQQDRLVLSQDANQRNIDEHTGVVTNSEWTFTKYDPLSRPVMTGIFTDPDKRNRAQWQALVSQGYAEETISLSEGAHPNIPTHRVLPPDNFGALQDSEGDKYLALQSLTLKAPTSGAQEYSTIPQKEVVFGIGDPMNGAGLTNTQQKSILVSDFPPADPSNQEIHSITFYDGYDDLPTSLKQGDYKYQSQACEGCPVQAFASVQGQVAASMVRILDQEGKAVDEWLSTITYYDDRYRPIQTIADNHLGGRDVISSKYINKVIDWVSETVLVHSNPNDPTRTSVTVRERTVYDHTGRPLEL